ncbi:MAG: hypothetical protein ABIJ00_11920, partial [Candidatus Eisenbacteria bacterium]
MKTVSVRIPLSDVLQKITRNSYVEASAEEVESGVVIHRSISLGPNSEIELAEKGDWTISVGPLCLLVSTGIPTKRIAIQLARLLSRTSVNWTTLRKENAKRVPRYIQEAISVIRFFGIGDRKEKVEQF